MNRYQNGDHMVFHGDAIDVLKSSIDDESVDLVFVDPPYNIGKQFGSFKDKWNSIREYSEWAYLWIDECLRVLKPNGTLYVMTSTQAMPFFDIYIQEKMKILSRIIWHYDSSGVQAKKYFGSMYEPILHCVKNSANYTFNSKDILVEAKTGSKRKLIDYRGKEPKPYNTKKVPGNVWTIPRVRYRMDEYEEHPTQKPIKLMKRIIRASSNEGDVILDPFSGSFTTSFVAKSLNRKSIGIEAQEDYVAIGLRRVLDMVEFQGRNLIKPLKRTSVKNKKEVLQEELYAFPKS